MGVIEQASVREYLYSDGTWQYIPIVAMNEVWPMNSSPNEKLKVHLDELDQGREAKRVGPNSHRESVLPNFS
jgi:hypothetical protein